MQEISWKTCQRSSGCSASVELTRTESLKNAKSVAAWARRARLDVDRDVPFPPLRGLRKPWRARCASTSASLSLLNSIGFRSLHLRAREHAPDFLCDGFRAGS